MQISINKTKITATIVMVLLMASAFMLMTNTAVQAQVADDQPVAGPLPSGVTADITVNTESYLSFSPNPIRKDQSLRVNMWMHPPIHVERQFIGAFEVTFTKPDGSQTVIDGIDSYCGNGSAWFPYIVDQVGTWKVKFDFPGGYFPAGNYTTYQGAFVGPQVSELGSVYYEPSTSGWILQYRTTLSILGPQLIYQTITGRVQYHQRTENGGPCWETTHLLVLLEERRG